MSALDWPESLDDAKGRALAYLNEDPFPHIPRALLSKEHIVAYAAKAGMIFPANGLHGEGRQWEKSDALKTASYETRPGYRVISYDLKGELISKELTSGEHGVIVLPANSITFVSTEDEFFLPNYIAMRFNLRIKHVHRGLLLGTGPLVDPGYDRRILIPLHNLTDSAYHISTDEGLIWVEFTKTSALYTHEPASKPPRKLAQEYELPKTTKKDIEEHLFKANSGFPIRSSIPKAVMDAQRSARLAEKRSRNLQAIGVVALISLAIGLVSVFVSVLSLVSTTTTQLRSIENRLGHLEEPKNKQ
jgi:deoxycytidine triphosphate deaminase